MQKSKGFTIIELLVVVAIIAVLTGIVLVNVTAYITKGKDAAAQGNLSTLLVNAAVLYDGFSKYDGLMTGASPTTGVADCTSTTTGWPTGTTLSWTGPCKALETAGYHVTNTCDVAACGATSTKFCAMVTLKGSGTPKFCVDSSGTKLQNATACSGGVCS